jgi:hypothetical protein
MTTTIMGAMGSARDAFAPDDNNRLCPSGALRKAEKARIFRAPFARADVIL